MTRTGWQKTWVRAVTTLMTITVMALIFFLSTETAYESDERSGFFSRIIISILHPDYEQMSAEKQHELYLDVQYVVRKCAHFAEYLILGFLIRLCLESWFGSRMKRLYILAAGAFAAGTAYACTDEAHQLMIDGRSGQWRDVLVDGGGVTAGAVLGTLLILYVNRKLSNHAKTGKNPD